MIKYMAVIGMLGWALLGEANTTPPPGETIPTVLVPSTRISDFPHEIFDIQSQGMSYRYDDIRVPGPNGFDIVVTRTAGGSRRQLQSFGFGWNLDIPYIQVNTVTGAETQDFGCLGQRTTVRPKLGLHHFGTKGFASADDLPEGTILSYQGNHVLRCESGKPVLLAPNGRTYHFDKVMGSHQDSLQYLVSKITDRFGNTITYHYGDDFKPSNSVSLRARLASISRNDGARVSFEYSLYNDVPQISAIKHSQQTRRYTYARSPYRGHQLEQAIDGAGQATQYKYEGPGSSIGKLQSVTLPTGGTITYRYDSVDEDRGRTGSVVTKAIAGPGLRARTISYVRRRNIINNIPHHIVIVTEHDDEGNTPPKKTSYAFRSQRISDADRDSGRAAVNGSITSIVVRYGGTPQLEDGEEYLRIENTWRAKLDGRVGCRGKIATGVYMDCGRAELVSTRMKVKHEEGFDTFGTDYRSYDAYGNLQHSVAFGNGFSRHVRHTAHNDRHHWRLGLPGKVERSADGNTWHEQQRTVYYPAAEAHKGLPSGTFRYGQQVASYEGYYPSGELRTARATGTDDFTEYLDYQRGIPERTRKPHPYDANASVYSHATVDEYGNIRSRTDFDGRRMDYRYDGHQRLTQQRYFDPLARWADETFDYKTVDPNDLAIPGGGLVAGQLKTMMRQGNYEQTTYFDGLGRVQLVAEKDRSDNAPTHYVRYRYNINHQVVFASFPSHHANETGGRETLYDPIGRIVMTRDVGSQNGTQRAYLSGNRVRYRDANGHETFYTYRTAGGPSYRVPQKIESPENVITEFTYNLFDNITEVTQGGDSAYYVYDSRQRVCKAYRPETQWTYVDYTPQGQVAWSASGIPGAPSSRVCDRERVPASEKIVRRYDRQHRLREQDYPDSTPDIVRTLNASGQLTALVNGDTQWQYRYNNAGLLNRMTLTTSGRTFDVTYDYNALHDIHRITYPSETPVDITVNALGQTTAINNVVTNVAYHPNGGTKAITYANGMTQTLSINDRYWPEHVQLTRPGGTQPINLSYGYDPIGNIASIQDRVSPRYSLSMSYDGLGRLATANGAWGTGGFTYDTVGNLRTQALGSRSLTYHYNSDTRRLESVTGHRTYLFDYDARGNVTENGYRPFVFNRANRLVASHDIALQYDGHHRRVKKSQGGKDDYFMYSPTGELLHKVSADGETTDYIYLNGHLVARNTFAPSTPGTTPLDEMAFVIDGRRVPITLSGNDGAKSVLQSVNLDDAIWIHAEWATPPDVAVQAEYKIDFVGNRTLPNDIDWTALTTFSAGTSSGILPLDQYFLYPSFPKLRVSTDRHDSVSGAYRNAQIYYRFRTYKNGAYGPWRYSRPLWIYNHS